MTVLFEDARIEWEYGRVPVKNPLLATVFGDFRTRAATHAWAPFLTCIYRTPKEDAAFDGHGVHTLWRAIDVRTRDVDPVVVRDVADFVNGRWTYDPTRPALVVVFTEPHGTGPHAHVQVHSKTRLRSAT